MRLIVLHRAFAALVVLQFLVPPWAHYSREVARSTRLSALRGSVPNAIDYLPLWTGFEPWQQASVAVGRLTIQLAATFAIYLLCYWLIQRSRSAEHAAPDRVAAGER